MKLRTRAGSLRLRLTRGEVDALASRGLVEESVVVGPGGDGRLVYALVASTAARDVTARLAGARITVELPAALAREWAASEQVGIEAVQAVGSGDAATTLTILVEKDFACLAPRAGEDDADAYPHPGAGNGGAC